MLAYARSVKLLRCCLSDMHIDPVTIILALPKAHEWATGATSPVARPRGEREKREIHQTIRSDLGCLLDTFYKATTRSKTEQLVSIG